MINRLATYAAVAAVCLAPSVALAPTAAAAPVVSPGMAWTGSATQPPDNPEDFCSIAAVGTDSSGNKVTFTSAHCLTGLNDGGTVYTWPAREPIGVLAWRDTQADFAVFKLNPDVAIDADGPYGRVDSLGTQPRLFQDNCKLGQKTGRTCGYSLGGTPTHNLSTARIGAGDSGGAQVVGTRWVGLSQANIGPSVFVRTDGSQGILAKVNAQSNPVGKGFVPTTN